METLFIFENSDTLTRSSNTIIASFFGKRKVLSTAPLNGGLKTNLTHVFNHNCLAELEDNSCFPSLPYLNQLKHTCKSLGLPEQTTSGFYTAAKMENVSIVSEHYKELSVIAAVTGGIDVNGARIGEPAHWHETEDSYCQVPGTINILLFCNLNLTDAALTRALVTCTEAKTAAIQELLAPSIKGSGVATGSGTDGSILICNSESPITLTESGKHFKLGELIGCSVQKAVKEALFLQTGLGYHGQFHIFSRLGRFGIHENALKARLSALGYSPEVVLKEKSYLLNNKNLVVLSSLYAHLLDQLNWAILRPEDIIDITNYVLLFLDKKREFLFNNEDFVSFSQKNLVNVFLDSLISYMLV